jgi:CRISPR-associated protein Csc1
LAQEAKETQMQLYLCRLVLHENLYYASREVGRLYETERCLHNYALTYALGLATAPYFQAQQVPRYAEELTPLNERGIYVTPARGVEVQYSLSTFKYASNLYHVEMEKGRRNTPSFGRAKEVAVGSTFEFVVLSAHDPLSLPRWVRLGLWRSKAALTWDAFDDLQPRSGLYTVALPLNPLDVSGRFMVFDLLSIPPVSLVQNAQMEGEYYELPNRLQLPVGMHYFQTEPQ